MNGDRVRLISAQVFVHACMAGLRMAGPLLVLRLDYSAWAVGCLLALFSLVQVFLALPAGRFADRHGLRRPIGLAVLASVAAGALAAVFPGYPALCVAALLTGGATGAASISLQRHVGRTARNATELKQVFSWLAIGPAISNFLGPFAAGLVIDAFGFRAAFGLMAVLPLVAWWCVSGVRELAPAPVAAPGPKPRALDLLAMPVFRRLLLVNWLLSSCWDVHTFVVPVLGHERGISASVIGAILGAFAISATAVRVAMPFVASRLRESAVVACAMAATAVLFTLYPLTRGELGMGVCSMALGVALGSVQPMIMSMLHQVTPAARHGEALGLRLMAINTSSVLMPILFGTLGALVGVAGLFWITGGIVAAGTRTAWRLRMAPESDAPHP